MHMERERHIVLVGDDSEDDRLFLRRLLRRLPEISIAAEVGDGEEAIAYLERRPPFDDASASPRPRLLLLDLKMPRKNGHDVLRWLRDHPQPGLAVLILSGSSLSGDIAESLALGARAYHTKSALPRDQEELLAKIRAALDGAPPS